MTAEDTASTRAAARPDPGRRTGGGLPGAIGAEWIKLWTVRSTWLCLVSAVVLQVAYSVIVGLASRAQQQGNASSQMSPGETAVGGMLYMAEFAVIALATLTIASEYATGGIRSTLLCVPVRGRMLAAKTLVASGVLLLAGVLLALLGTVIAMLTLESPDHGSSAGDDVIAHALAIGAYAALVAVLIIGLGAVMRSVAGTLSVLAVVMLVVPIALILSKLEILTGAANFFPGPAGLHLMYGDTGPYGRGVALLVLGAWAALAQFAGYLVLRARDA
jgi:ABC-2 type transport system permease protein